MSRYIDAERIDWRLIIPTNPTTAEEYIIHMAKKLVDRQPIADVVDVVRCKDCKFKVQTLQTFCVCNKFDYITGNDGFCSHGERREDAKIH